MPQITLAHLPCRFIDLDYALVLYELVEKLFKY